MAPGCEPPSPSLCLPFLEEGSAFLNSGRLGPPWGSKGENWGPCFVSVFGDYEATFYRVSLGLQVPPY
jgi:hypothetical protein